MKFEKDALRESGRGTSTAATGREGADLLPGGNRPGSRGSRVSRWTCWTLAVGFGLLTVTAPLPALAADDSVVWGVQPSTPDGPDGRTTFEYQVAPGSIISDWVAVTNHGATPATLRVYGADATVDYGSGAFTLVGAESASTDLGAWATIDGGASVCVNSDDDAEAACAATLGTSITIEPGARANIPFTITVPHDATPGDHSAGVVAGLLSEATGEGTSVRREDRVGARIYLRVDGPLSPGLALTGAVGGYGPSWIPFAPGTASAGFDVVNAGNTRISFVPEVRLTGPFGIDLKMLALDPISNLVPGARAHINAELPGIPPVLLMFVDLTLTPTPAEGIAAGDPLPAAVTSSAVSWAVPWTGLAAVGLLAAGVWLVRWSRRRTRALLAEELAEYAERLRGELAPEPVPAGAGFLPRDRQADPT